MYRPLQKIGVQHVMSKRGFKLDESGAQVSPKHCGFVVNNGGTASAADVLRLIRYVQQTVLDKQGVKIEPEVRLIGKF